MTQDTKPETSESHWNGEAEGDQSLPLSYSAYLRVPDLLACQTPLSRPRVHDELLFIILQQAQELWFKQLLHELQSVIALIQEGRLPSAVRLLDRSNAVLDVLRAEVEVMETLPPTEFQRFRGLLTPASGFESFQFRELEFASGLRNEKFLRVVAKLLDLETLQRNWPVSLHDAFRSRLREVEIDPVEALVRIFRDPDSFADVYALSESLSEYELRFSKWRFYHLKLVERVIGDRAPGTGGSPGGSYLGATLDFRFFPELWEARNQISSAAPAYRRVPSTINGLS